MVGMSFSYMVGLLLKCGAQLRSNVANSSSVFSAVQEKWGKKTTAWRLMLADDEDDDDFVVEVPKHICDT